ncbi:unnamed protein product [Acanthoscelides obtectus]|nr:unnamed protein product [Acanthoscelides obtectus]
MADSVLY